MLSNLHTHSVFCDGKNTPEECVTYAIEKGFNSIGFSGHGYTEFDIRYCMKNTGGYINEIKKLKSKYRKEIQIYLGIEEDAFSWCNRDDFDYIIGSSHYFNVNDTYMPIDSSHDYFKKCLEAFNYDIIKLSDCYYRTFCDYIKKRKPDIIGHFDLITKFDKIDNDRFLNNSDYNKLAERYIEDVAICSCIFEINTGVISRGYRDFPYPAENLIYAIKKNNGMITLSSDCHEVINMDFKFSDVRKWLKDIGFQYIYTMYNGEFTKDYL